MFRTASSSVSFSNVLLKVVKARSMISARAIASVLWNLGKHCSSTSRRLRKTNFGCALISLRMKRTYSKPRGIENLFIKKRSTQIRQFPAKGVQNVFRVFQVVVVGKLQIEREIKVIISAGGCGQHACHFLVGEVYVKDPVKLLEAEGLRGLGNNILLTIQRFIANVCKAPGDLLGSNHSAVIIQHGKVLVDQIGVKKRRDGIHNQKPVTGIAAMDKFQAALNRFKTGIAVGRKVNPDFFSLSEYSIHC